MPMTDERPGPTSRYFAYLPAVYQEETTPGQFAFLNGLLLAFEQVLTGAGDSTEPGLEELLDGIVDPLSGDPLSGDPLSGDPLSGDPQLVGVSRYFDPGPGAADTTRAPREFLPWLAGWVALMLRADLDEDRQREFIANAVALYRLRGTKQGLEAMIRTYTKLAPSIDEFNTPFQLGVHSTVGVDTVLDGGVPHFFRVRVRLPKLDVTQRKWMQDVTTAIIEMEKPAHTHYQLDVSTPTLQLGVTSTIGVDTLLGTQADR
jgi:phage tail-like protein